MSAIKKIESLGVKLSAEGENLIVTGKTSLLSQDQIKWLKEHKPQILAELESANQPEPSTRLRSFAPKYRLDPDELLNWYRNDLDMISCMDDNTLEILVRDYAANRPTFRGEQTYQPYRLWLYKINEGDPGFVRQGLMVSDPDQAQKQLTQIYGKAVIALHQGRK